METVKKTSLFVLVICIYLMNIKVLGYAAYFGESETVKNTIVINSKGEVDGNSKAYLLSGMKFNKIVKSLVNGKNMDYDDMDEKVITIQWTNAVPPESTSAIVSKEDSPSVIEVFFEAESGTLYLVNPDQAEVYMDTDSSYIFNSFASLEEIDLSLFKTDEVTNLEGMFAYCYCLKNANMDGWNVEHVTDLSSVFILCKALESVSTKGWNPCSVTETDSMFSMCDVLQTVDFADWNTACLESTYYMFSSCTSLVDIDLSGWNTNKLTTAQRMFDDCLVLETVNLQGWQTGNLTNTSNMFRNTRKMKEIRLDNFDMSSITSKGSMMYRVAYTSKSCRIYCTEQTKSVLLSGTSITTSYFTFIHPQTAATLSLSRKTENAKPEHAASGSNAVKVPVASGSNAVKAPVVNGSNTVNVPVASDSNAMKQELAVLTELGETKRD